MIATTRMQTILLTALVAAGVTLTTGAALAMTLTCTPDIECFGSSVGDTFDGTAGNEYVWGYGGDDVLTGKGGVDALAGDGQDDTSLDGDDTLSAGAGNDDLAGDGSKDVIDCGSGTDQVYFDKRLDQLEANCEERHAA